MAGGLGADNSANMIAAAVKYSLGAGVTVYADLPETINAKYAHYDLGAGGRAVTTDCHEGGLPASGDTASNPHCWAGGRLVGFSVGANKKF
ncbi:MAG TPA: hypothetical protein VFG53_09045 [Anaeromyxobacter sp.]|nr:hypothetical protein [Anaeromyxobacter sp.]